VPRHYPCARFDRDATFFCERTAARRTSPSLKGNRDAGLQQCPTEIAEAGFAPDGLWNHLL
jgi:hypothetical protein